MSSSDPASRAARRLALLREQLARESAAAGEEDRHQRILARPREPVDPSGPDGSGPHRAPLTSAQERLWFLARLAPASPVFHVPAAFRLEGALEPARLRSALDRLVARHGALRTAFVVEDGRPLQEVRPAARAEIVGEELAAEGREERRREALARARAAARRPFALDEAPLLRLGLWRVAPDEHLLLVDVHHAVCEVQSLAILVRELFTFYQDPAAALPEPAVDLADFAAWQRARAGGERAARDLAYWDERLAGTLPTLQLPTDRPRPAVQDFAGATRSRTLSAEVAARLRELAREERTTPFVVLLAAWAALLQRYGGQDDLLIGAPMTDRNRPELEGVVGFFVATLVLRCDLAGDPSFRELVRRAREVVLGAQSHQDVPFELLVQRLQPERDLSRSPLFQVAFLLQTEDESALRLPPLDGLAVRPLDALDVHTDTSKFDASLIVWDRSGGFTLSFEYSTSLFDAPTIERMLAHLEGICSSAAAAPDAPLSGLRMLGPDEERTLLHGWNSARLPLPQDACVQRLFEAQVDRTPDAVALAAPESMVVLSYRQLDERANRLAHRLRRLGVGPEVPVGICTERAPEMVVGILATLKAGGAYVPLDLGYPAERLGFMLRDAGARVVLTRAALRGRLPLLDVPVLALDELEDELAAEPAERPAAAVGPRNLAYLIYTSGSTGEPKGVELEHAGLVNLATWHVHEYGVGPGDRATHLAGLAFDASVWELWPYLLAGAAVHLVPDDVRLSPAGLLRFFVREGITLSFVPTPLCEALLQEPLPDGLRLRAVLTGGDKLHHAPPAPLPFRLVNHYGPTENTVVATATEVRPDPAMPAPPIGRAIANVQVYLLDPLRRPVPVGVPGELFVGGASLARGYHGRPDLTALKFVRNPLPGTPGERLYATGDLARWRPDGEIEFLGRIDAQVKVRGFRIELGEVETVLGQHPAVADCAVVLRQEQDRAGRLVAYHVARPGTDPAPDDLRGHLRARLPEYMVPATFVRLDGLPLTPNGKVDRRALPAPPPEDGAGAAGAFVAPRGELEERIAAVWREALGLERVAADASFFEVGGHSLLLAQVHARLQASLDPGLSILELFHYPTIGALARHLAERRSPGETLQAGRERGAGRRARLRELRRERPGS